jgi:hypothetical protein
LEPNERGVCRPVLTEEHVDWLQQQLVLKADLRMLTFLLILLNGEALGREHHYNLTEVDEDLGVQLLNDRVSLQNIIM